MMNQRALIYLANEFVPVVGFFIVAQTHSFFAATGVLMLLTAIALIVGWYYERHLPVIPIVSSIFVIVSGLATLVSESPDVLIFSDSLYYFVLGLAVAIGLAFRINILKRIFGHIFAIQDSGWRILANRWIIIFFLGGVVNEMVRLFASPEIWVKFKLMKVVILFIFGVYQFTVARKYRIPEESNHWGLRH